MAEMRAQSGQRAVMEFFEQERDRRRLTQVEFGELIGASKDVVSNTKNGRTQLTFDRYLEICEALRMDPTVPLLAKGLASRDVPLEDAILADKDLTAEQVSSLHVTLRGMRNPPKTRRRPKS